MAKVRIPYYSKQLWAWGPREIRLPSHSDNSWQTNGCCGQGSKGNVLVLPRNTYKIIGEGILGLFWMYKLFIFAVLIEKSWRRLMLLGSVFIASKRLNVRFMTVQSSSFWNRYYSPAHPQWHKAMPSHPISSLSNSVGTSSNWPSFLKPMPGKELRVALTCDISKESLVLILTNWVGEGATVFNQLCIKLNLSLHQDLMRKIFFFWKNFYHNITNSSDYKNLSIFVKCKNNVKSVKEY